MRKPREQFELFSYDETHNIGEWDDATWICECPKIKTDPFRRCNECHSEPPGGDINPAFCDLTTFWEE